MTVKFRQRLERAIARRVIKDAIAAGYSLDVYDCEEFTLVDSRDETAILKAMFTTDDDRLYLRKDGKRVGWVWFVYGNSGWDVISDYTTNLEEVLKGADKLADRLEETYA